MKSVKARGIVLREYEAGESDKRLLLLCKGYGKIVAYARGARKPSSKFMACAQLFTYADFVLTQGSNFHSLAQAEVIENFYPIRQNYDRFVAACLIAGVCEKTLWENLDCDELLLLLLKSFSNLARGKLPTEQIICVFLFRFFTFHGTAPQVDSCVLCSTPANEMKGGAFLSPEGLACCNHKPHICRPVSAAAVAALTYIQKSDLAKSFLFNAHENVLKELRQAVDFLWENYSQST